MENFLKIMAKLEKKSNLFNLLLGIFLIGIIGLLDFLIGTEIHFSVFYAIPVFLVTWFVGQPWGITTAIISVLAHFGVEITLGKIYSNPLLMILNILIRLMVFLISVSLLSALKISMEKEKKLARTDYLTGAVNSRFFLELLEKEIDRLARYKQPFTLVYIDLDNFKMVNDQFGHFAGDQALCTVTNYAQKYLRKVDTIARLGGDEFALLLPETSQKSAHIILEKLQSNLVEKMQKNNWPVTLSVGVLTCKEEPPNANKIITMADDLMYLVKNDGKNAIRYSTYPDDLGDVKEI